MSAPALVLLGYGSRDARSTAVALRVADEVARRRPTMTVHTAFLDRAEPSLVEAVRRLAAEGHDEAVVVPLLFSPGRHLTVDVPAAVAAADAACPDVRVGATESLGLRPGWLGVVDERLREALARARARDLDGLVLAAAGSSDPRVHQAVTRLARQWSQRHRLPVVTAYAAVTGPSSGEAVRGLRTEGRRHVAVGSLFLAPGRMPDRVAELALEAGAVAVSAPLGDHDEVVRTVLARYAVGAVNLVPV